MTDNAPLPNAFDGSAARRGMPPWLSLLVRTGVTAGLMAYAVRTVKWSDVGGQLASGQWGWWIAGLLGSVAVQVVAGMRWAALARPLGFDRPRRFFIWRFFEGMLFNLCLPSSIGGDVIKAYRVGDTTSHRLLAGCSILADRLTGLAALGVLAVTALAAEQSSVLTPAAVAAIGAAVLAVVLAGFWIGTQCLDRILGLLPAEHAARRFIARLLPYQERPMLLIKAIGWSFVVQMGGALVVGLMARTVGVDLGPVAWFSVVPLVALLTVLPVSIGGFGVRETAMAKLLGHYGVPPDKGIAVALLWSLSGVAMGLLGGVLFLIDRKPAERGADPA